jgi:glycosyltransferase involved in cell wall biosynthesis
MNNKQLIFFTTNNFSRSGGARIRMSGILNSLVKENIEVVLISNIKDTAVLNSKIIHIPLSFTINQKGKRIFQFCMALFPNFINRIIFKKYLNYFDNIDLDNKFSNDIIFFEYLDNSLALFFKDNNKIKDYINDIHGIAPLEFLHNDTPGIKKIYNYIRYFIAELLDNKVINSSKSIIVISETMKKYYIKKYPTIKNNVIVLGDGVSEEVCCPEINLKLQNDIENKFNEKDIKYILFAGAFKDLGGILDLIKAFIKLIKSTKRTDTKLILIGKGEHFIEAQNLIKEAHIQEYVYFEGIVNISYLKYYQNISSIIVCPDKKHPYTNMILHIKYLNALASNKVVIAGASDAIVEVNEDEKLSVNYESSNIDDLSDTLNTLLNNYEKLKQKYIQNSQFICEKYSYLGFVKESGIMK